MFPVTIICEGSSENAYLQSLNKILRCTNVSWNVGPFIPRVAHQGYYGSVIGKLKEEQHRAGAGRILALGEHTKNLAICAKI